MDVDHKDLHKLTTDKNLRVTTLKLNSFVHCGRMHEFKQFKDKGIRARRGLDSGLCAGDRKHGTQEVRNKCKMFFSKILLGRQRRAAHDKSNGWTMGPGNILKHLCVQAA